MDAPGRRRAGLVHGWHYRFRHVRVLELDGLLPSFERIAPSTDLASRGAGGPLTVSRGARSCDDRRVASTDDSDDLRWFSVRCLFSIGDSMYEERITVWRARDHDHAIELAEAEAYSDDDGEVHLPIRTVEFAQSYELFDEPGTSGSEVFSLIRDSELSPRDSIDRFFDTGGEHAGDLR